MATKTIKKPIIVTSALPYANGPIHIGHLVEYIETDIFVRFLKLIKENVVYCCADDTHGTPIQISAEKEGIIPEELIGRYHQEHLRDFTTFLIKFDSYYSTNSEENKYFSDLIFKRLKSKNLIYKKEVELAYCNKCKKFLPDRYIKGKCPKCNAPDQYGDVCENCNAAYKTTDLIDPYCTVCGGTPTRKLSEHYFFKLSEFSDKLKKWFETNKNLQPEIINYLKNWLKEGLQDWDISRDGPYFGFRIPDEDNLYYYVWLDAPIGYISSFSNTLKGDVKKAEQEWNKSRIIHFIGKDIIYFHFLFWPAMLIGADFNLPENIVVHGFLTVNKEKMSKSRGTFFTAEEFASKYNPEYLRFYYSKVLSKKLADIDLEFKDFKDSTNNELVGNIGNFCYRTLSFTNKFFNSEIKDIEENKELIDGINKKVENIKKSYNEVNYNEALKEILSISDLGNQYFQKNEPWKLVKTDKEKAQKIVSLCVNIVKNISILLQPILPNFSEKLQEQLGLENLRWNDINFNFNNREINKAEILINKFEEIEEKKEKTPEIEYEIKDKVKELGLKFHLAQINEINVKKKHEGLEKLKKEIETKIKKIDLSNNKIYTESKSFYKDKSFEPPYAYLISLVKEKGKLPTINTVVDSYNLVSVKYLVSVGVHDAAKIEGKVRFKITDGSERYIPLGSKSLEAIKPGEYACADDKEVLCRLDIKQCESTKVENKTKSIMVYVQGNKENEDDDLRKALKEICENIVKFCGGEYKLLGKEETFPLDLKVAEITKVEDHQDADKLYIMQTNLGKEKRQIVASIKPYYKKEELKGKKIIIVTNLKPAKFRGEISNGMLLAVESKDDCGLLYVKKSSAGSQVAPHGFKINKEQITFDQFSKLKLKAEKGKVTYNGKTLKTDKEDVKIDKFSEGLVC